MPEILTDADVMALRDAHAPPYGPEMRPEWCSQWEAIYAALDELLLRREQLGITVEEED